ncbi:TlpA disulfide reductase family protein [Stenotrophomonas sp. CFBP8994]|jgi:thiol-disulfide isomerase/thioredoxin|uniref:TlpA family protein disulfide reductase n=1 Tax=Stenotrophomonas sp. CFBP8994 TaxID=3096527 RepID=UPI002A6A48B9|nr:TlpA disulfide reductase family protein [Stenotrophomonas sp. CFBP8994]MDY0979811.1 TlpA disulfide reductase family protein [Stenotrophomonas sp. CFBP8994]
MSTTPPRTSLMVVAALAAALGLGTGVYYVARTPQETRFPAVERPAAAPAQPGDAMPAITLPDVDGTPLDFARFGGRPLLINVWASWCGPCVEEMPMLAAFAAAQPADGVQVVGLAIDTPDGVRDFLDRVPVTYPIVIEQPAPDDASVRLGNAQGLLPYTVLVGADGKIVKQKLGPFADGEIERWVGSTDQRSVPTAGAPATTR